MGTILMIAAGVALAPLVGSILIGAVVVTFWVISLPFLIIKEALR